MSRQIGSYQFPNPQPLSDAKPPKGVSGVYAILVKSSPESEGAVRYVGSTSDLQSRVNWGHEKAKTLLREAGGKPDNVLVTWIEVGNRFRYLGIEKQLIAHFGSRLDNVERETK